MAQEGKQGIFNSGRLLIISGVVTIVVIGLILLILAISQPTRAVSQPRVDALATSDDACVVCHRRSTPGIVEQFGHSTMAAAKVSCKNCHEVKAGYPDAVEHEGTYVLRSPTTAMCQKCHGSEVAQFYQSRHGLPAYVAYAGTGTLSADLKSQYLAIPEAQAAPDKARSALYAIEDPHLTKFACETCHSVGAPRPDGSVGNCQKCHLRHEFSLEQARKPETCNNCHIGPDHPQWEIYVESPHGISYNTMGQTWNWTKASGTLTVSDFPAPTCAICHMSGFGASGTTHDVGDRLTWFSSSQVSARRPNWEGNKVQMQNVCRQCHNQEFIDTFYTNADQAEDSVNNYVKQADAIMQPLVDQKLVTTVQFDDPIKFVYFEIWHHWGRTAKFGTWMQGPDYTQWHGVYEMLKGLSELKDMATKMQSAAAGNH